VLGLSWWAELASSIADARTRHATQPAFVYRHEWQVGDVVMWDNGFVLHRRDPYEASQNHLLKRTTLRRWQPHTAARAVSN
jgi:alpha-ketoglutarate-dependent taurine dioxygenase